jgi:hypothetical protein
MLDSGGLCPALRAPEGADVRPLDKSMAGRYQSLFEVERVTFNPIVVVLGPE